MPIGDDIIAVLKGSASVEKILRGGDLIADFTTPSGIIVGTAGFGEYSLDDGTSYTFTTPPTVDGGGAALLVIGLIMSSFGARNSDWANGVSAFTLDGNAPDVELFEYMQNTGSDKYVQAVAAIWNSPSAGDVVLTLNNTAVAAGYYFMNLSNLHASPLGVLVREQIGTGTALPFQATTTVANSLLIALNGARGPGKGPFAFDDGNFTSIGETDGSTSGEGSWDIGYQNGVAAGTYDCGGDWTTSDTDRLSGLAFELKAAA